MFSANNSNHLCEGPLLLWLILYVFLYLGKLLHSVATMYYAYKNNPKTKTMSYIKYFGINMVQMIWLIYGNVIYFNSERNASC